MQAINSLDVDAVSKVYHGTSPTNLTSGSASARQDTSMCVTLRSRQRIGVDFEMSRRSDARLWVDACCGTCRLIDAHTALRAVALGSRAGCWAWARQYHTRASQCHTSGKARACQCLSRARGADARGCA